MEKSRTGHHRGSPARIRLCHGKLRPRGYSNRDEVRAPRNTAQRARRRENRDVISNSKKLQSWLHQIGK